MAEYIFTPKDTVHPSREDLDLLARLNHHDFRGDLSHIIGALDVLTESRQLTREDIVIQRHRVQRAVDHVLTVSNANSDLLRSSILMQSGDIVKIINRLARHADLPEVQSTLPEIDRMFSNRADVVYLQLYHFIQNAKHHGYIPRESTVTLGAEVVKLTPPELVYLGRNAKVYFEHYPDTNFVRAFVTDNGKGIVEEDFPKLFQPRNHSSDKGVGLGLANYICDIIHGFIKVESEVGKGSTFSLYFPQERKC